MKSFLRLGALVASMATLSAQQSGNSPVKIFIMVGQSNMLGHGNISPAGTKGTLEYVVAEANDPGGTYQFAVDGEGDWVVRDDVWIKDQYGNASGLTAGYGAGANDSNDPVGSNIGPELGFGHAMGAFYEEQILIVKAAWGGKSLGNDFLPPSSGPYPTPTAEGDTGFYYQEVLNLVSDAIANLGTYFPDYETAGGYEIAGFCWHQGWNDRVTPAFSAVYETNMANFIRDIRSDLGEPNMPFVIATSAMDGNGSLTYTDVELAQRAMTDPYLTNPTPPDLYTDFAGSVAVVDCRQTFNGWAYTGLEFWQDAANSPQNQGFHWNRNAKTYLNIGLAMADEMSILAPSLCPSNLQASAGATSGVTLDWLNWDNIPTSVQVLRDGVEVAAALPGSNTSFEDTAADPGILDYELVFTMPGDSCAPLTVTFDGSITGLEAVRNGGTVTLTWSNTMSYSGIKVLRNGVVIEPNLVGTSESFIDLSPLPSGSVIYQVEPTTGTSTPAQARINPYWDGGSLDIATDGNGASDGGSGTWDTTTLNWDEGAAPHVAWNNASDSMAIFGGAAGTVTIATGGIAASGLDITGGYTFDGDPLTLTLAASIANDATVNFFPEIISSTGLTKTGNGTLVLRNDNAISGDLAINGGTLQLGNNADAASLSGSSYAGDVFIADGAELFDKSNTTLTLSGVISGGGILNKGGSGTLTLTGANTYTGRTKILGSGAGGPQMSVSSFNSVTSGSIETGGGPVATPIASSSLGAPTTVSGGTIELGSTGNQRNSTLYYTGFGETTDRVMQVGFNSRSDQTIYANTGGLLKFTSTFVINRSSGSKDAAFILRGTGDGEIAAGTTGGIIPGYLGKLDAGTWTLGGTTTVDDLDVSNGTLIIDVGGTIDATDVAPDGTGVVTASGGTLTVDGALKFVTTTVSGGTLDGSGTLSFDIDGTSADQVVVTGGSLDISGLSAEIVPGVGGLTEAEYVLVDATGGGTLTGTFTGFSGTPPSGYSLDYGTANQVKLVGGVSIPFDTWAGTGTLPGTVTFEGDLNADGVQDGLAFLLGVANPDDDANGSLPTVSEDGSGNLVMEFDCLPIADRGTAELRVAHSNTLASFTATVDQVPDADDLTADNEVTFVVDTVSEAPLNKITATIDLAAAVGGKLFGRLEATE